MFQPTPFRIAPRRAAMGLALAFLVPLPLSAQGGAQTLRGTTDRSPAITADMLARPLDMMVDQAAERAATGGVVPAPDASPAQRALGLFQRGFHREARGAALAVLDSDVGVNERGAAAALLALGAEQGLGTKRDDAEAVRRWREAAELGNAAARHALAIRLATGEGVERDTDTARAELRALAEAGRAEAAFDWAQLVLSDPAGDRAEGERALSIAAELGLSEAQYALAGVLMSRADADADREARASALRWMVAAARAGQPEAQLELGLWLAEGRAGPADPPSARGWMERAAVAGQPVARNRLAHMLRLGIGGSTDPIRAARWHALARGDGVIDADLDALVAGLSEAERGEAFAGLPPRAVAAALRSAASARSAAPPSPRVTQSGDEAEGLPGVRLGAPASGTGG